MITRIHSFRRPRLSRRRLAMTLLELMTVVTILVVLLGVSAPIMKGFSKTSKLRAAARDVVALMKLARTEAVLGQRMTEVFFDLDQQVYWLDLRKPDPKTGVYKPSEKKTQMELEREFDGCRIEEITAYDSNIIKGKIIAVDFYPDGTASPIILTLVTKEGKRMTLEVLKPTGMCEVTPGTIDDKRAKEAEESVASGVPSA